MQPKQDQKVAGNSQGYQAGESINIYEGITYKDAKEIALDVFENNFYRLAKAAHKIARQRAEEIIGQFLSALHEKRLLNGNRFHEPGFQYSIFKMAREYANSGNTDLGDLLMRILIKKAKESNRSNLDVYLGEALDVAPRLSDEMLAILSIKLIFEYSLDSFISSYAELGIFFDEFVSPFLDELPSEPEKYSYLEYTGCCVNSPDQYFKPIQYGGYYVQGASSNNKILEYLFEKHIYLFESGFTKLHAKSSEVDERLLTHCLWPGHPDWDHILDVKNESDLEKKMIKYIPSEEKRVKIRKFFQHRIRDGRFSTNRVAEKCIEIRPYMRKIIQLWESKVQDKGSRFKMSPMASLELTPIGIVIAHANVTRLVREPINLSSLLS